MTITPPLQPTLWRTCRVLANRTRLRIPTLLVNESPQTVSEVAVRLELPLPVTSQSLRALEARGLLTARRAGRCVRYRFTPSATGAAGDLLAPLQLVFRRGPSPIDTLYRLSTAFTHPRRLQIFQALQKSAARPGQVQAATGISGPALWRHLRKLQARGFVRCRDGVYSARPLREAFARALARLAKG
jgi:DNA-binding transcriptional ArsR family regulator